MKTGFLLNGGKTELEASPERRTLDLLRQDLGLTGTKEGCGSGECGACAILVDGVTRASCLMLAAQLQGRDVVTIEGIGEAGALHPVQQGFIEAGALHPVQQGFIEAGAVQCGFCTPGMVLSSVELLGRLPHPTREEIRGHLSGHICRCTGYQKIVDAVERAAHDRNRRPCP